MSELLAGPDLVADPMTRATLDPGVVAPVRVALAPAAGGGGRGGALSARVR